MNYTDSHKQFAEDMTGNGYDVRDYQGGNFYNGPAVECTLDELQEVLRATVVPCIWDSMGLDLIVYPK